MSAEHFPTVMILLVPQRRSRLNDSQTETLRRFQSGESVEQIARARGFVPSTIYSHLLAAIESGKLPQAWERFFTPAQENEIAAAFRQVASGTLVDVSALLGGKYDIGLLRIFRELHHDRSRPESTLRNLVATGPVAGSVGTAFGFWGRTAHPSSRGFDVAGRAVATAAHFHLKCLSS